MPIFRSKGGSYRQSRITGRAGIAGRFALRRASVRTGEPVGFKDDTPHAFSKNLDATMQTLIDLRWWTNAALLRGLHVNITFEPVLNRLLSLKRSLAVSYSASTNLVRVLDSVRIAIAAVLSTVSSLSKLGLYTRALAAVTIANSALTAVVGLITRALSAVLLTQPALNKLMSLRRALAATANWVADLDIAGAAHQLALSTALLTANALTKTLPGFFSQTLSAAYAGSTAIFRQVWMFFRTVGLKADVALSRSVGGAISVLVTGFKRLPIVFSRLGTMFPPTGDAQTVRRTLSATLQTSSSIFKQAWMFFFATFMGTVASNRVWYPILAGFKRLPIVLSRLGSTPAGVVSAPVIAGFRWLTNLFGRLSQTQRPVLEPGLSLDDTSYAPGAQITVTVQGGFYGLQEWVALYVASDDDSNYSYQGNWQYLNGTKTQPISEPIYPIVLTFTAPSVTGSYNIRMFRENDVANRLVISSDITVANPSIYYVATDGDDDTGDGTLATPYRTIGHALDVATLDPAGRVVMVMDGVYDEVLPNKIPSGSSWDAPFVLKSYTPLGATIQPTSNAPIIEVDYEHSYFAIDGFVIDGSQQTEGHDAIRFSAYNFGDIHHVRVINNEIKNAGNSGFSTGKAFNLEFRGNAVHHCARIDTSGLSHAVYATCAYSILEENDIHDHAYGYGFHFYNGFGGTDMYGNVVRNNWFHGVSNNTGAAILGSGFDMQIYNNVIWDCGLGISGNQGGDNIEVCNNTIYNGNTYGIQNAYCSNFNCTNNLVIDNGTAEQIIGATDELTNITSGVATDLWVNPASADFRLKAGSAAIDAGTDVAMLSTDIVGTFRTSPYDVGAYEATA